MTTPVHVSPPEPAPILLRGRALAAVKGFRGGTHRLVSPEETLARLLPILPRIGVTRLANITGLDRVGIPVVLAHRPNGATLSNGGGKGVTLVAAKVSAGMEALEVQHAETPTLPFVECPYDAVPAAQRMHPDGLGGIKGGLFRADLPEAWVTGWDLMGQREIAVPWNTVFMVPSPMRAPRQFIAMTTNGLASGNHVLEALAAALYEVIERDAVSCSRYAETVTGKPVPRVDLRSVAHPVIDDLMARFERAGIEPLLFDRTADLGIPVFESVVYDREMRHVGLGRGYGCHLDPAVAAARALTEAVQGRTIVVAGARDDIFRRDLRAIHMADDGAEIVRMEASPASVSLSRYADRSTATFEGDIALMLTALGNAGLDQAVVFELTKPEIGIPVVKVVVPGLEGYLIDCYAPGRRAIRFAGQQAAA
jgi:ribosomal protein S12 methylthiotransferase accessory factor